MGDVAAHVGEHIGDRIERLRRDRGWTQEQIAERAGVKQNQISAWERKQVPPSMSSLEKLAVAFEMPWEALASGASFTMAKESTVGTPAASPHPSREAPVPPSLGELPDSISEKPDSASGFSPEIGSAAIPRKVTIMAPKPEQQSRGRVGKPSTGVVGFDFSAAKGDPVALGGICFAVADQLARATESAATAAESAAKALHAVGVTLTTGVTSTVAERSANALLGQSKSHLPTARRHKRPQSRSRR